MERPVVSIPIPGVTNRTAPRVLSFVGELDDRDSDCAMIAPENPTP
jgi:hypothetical protein